MSKNLELKAKLEEITRTYKSWNARFYKLFLFSLFLGVLCGFMMVLFFYLLMWFRIGFLFLPFFIAPLVAGVLTALLVKYGKCSRVLGSGISEFMKEVKEIKSTHGECNLNETLFVKPIATSWTFGSGMMCGRYGPGLIIGGSLGFLASKRFKEYREDSFFIGASACTAAILKAPISGAIFCGELPYNNHIRYKTLIPSFIASIVSYFIFCLFFGFSPLITAQINISNEVFFNFGVIFPILVLFGVFVGLVVFMFNNIFLSFTKKMTNFYEQKSKLWALPLTGSLGYCIFLLIVVLLLTNKYHNAVIAPDARFLNLLISNINQVGWEFFFILIFLLVIAILLSIGTLNSAGIVFPMILFGAVLGGFFGLLFYPQNPVLFMLLGIPAVLGASTKNPVASVILIVEMTWIPLLFVPAAIVTIFAYLLSGPSSLISGQYEAIKIS